MNVSDGLLEYLEGRIDLDHCSKVDRRYQKSLNFEQVDRPPLVIQCEEHPLGQQPFPFMEAFNDTDKMLFNMLLTRICPYVELQDDGPLAIRADFGTVVVASILIRDDSIINISADMYKSIVRPHDEYVLREMGGGSIHFCGNGRRQIEAMLEIEPLRGFDFGESNLMDVRKIYSRCAERHIPVTNIMVSPDDVFSGKAIEEYPTGVVLTCAVKTLAEAREVVCQYHKKAKDV